MPLECCQTADEWEREDFFKFFTLMFQKRKIQPKIKKDWTEEDLYNAIENGTVREVMEIAGALHNSKKYTKEVRNRIFDQLVYVRELWHADIQPQKNGTALKVFGGTPWRYFHDFLRRKEFHNMEYILMNTSNNGYYIFVEELKPSVIHVSKLLGRKRIKEYGIADEKKSYLPCDCNFENLLILCSRCNGFVYKQECQRNPEHKFFQRNLRCFKIEHGKEMKDVLEPETVSWIVGGGAQEKSIEKLPSRFYRNQDARKSSRRKITPSDKAQSEENVFNDDPELITENITQRLPPRYQPRFDDFIDPYSPIKVQQVPEESRVEEVKIMPPPREIPLEQKEELPPLPIHADTLQHYREPEKRYSPIRVPSECPSPTFRSQSSRQVEVIPFKSSPPEREPKPQTLPRTEKSPKIIPIPLHRYDPPPTTSPSCSTVPQIPPCTPKLKDYNLVSPIPVRRRISSPIQSFDPDFVKYRPGQYDYTPTGRPQDRPLSDGVIFPNKSNSPFRPASESQPKRPITPVLPRPIIHPPPPPISALPKSVFNVLLIGPTGIGKSTRINAFANYLRYTKLGEAKQGHLISVIPAKFTLQDRANGDHVIEYGENHRPGESATQHIFHINDKVIVNIIDTPGICDADGRLQDEIYRRKILEEIKSLSDPPELHAIAILLRSHEKELTASFENAIYQLLDMFPKSALNNIVFFFTHARGTMFQNGDTVTILTELFTKIKKNHGTEISLKPESFYRFDNEAFRYLIACATRRPELEKLCLPFEKYDTAWSRSPQESTKFIDHLQHVEPLPNFEVVFYNCVKDIAKLLAEILISHSKPDEIIIETYEVIIDYLIQEGIIRRDPLMRQIIASKKDIPIELMERLFVDKRLLLPRNNITKKDVCDAIDEIQELKNIEETLIQLIQYVIHIFVEQSFKHSSDQESIYHRKRMDESYELLPLITDERLGFIRGEPNRYSCYSEIHEVVNTERVTTTTRTPPPFTDRFSTTIPSKNTENRYIPASKKTPTPTTHSNMIPLRHVLKKLENYDKKVNAIGIDLGTSNCCVAVNRKNGIEIAAIDNTGERILPTYVSFDEKHEKCGKVVVDRLETFSKSTVFDIKRIIGRSYPDVIKDSTWPFEIIPDGKSVKIQIQNHLGEITEKSPEEISAVLLRFIKQKICDFQGQNLTSVVIAIPASFTKDQESATITSAKLAGWKTVHLIPEPVAASFAYFIDRPLPNNATILLFDLGGGTLDICIFEIKNSEYQLVKNIGDCNLGGRNFDKILYKYFKNKLLFENGVNVGRNERKKYQLMLKCQKIKHELTIRKNDFIIIEDYHSSNDDETISKIEITRQQFEQESNILIKNIKNLLHCATDDLQNPINNVLHVGGGSRMPMIKNLLKEMFPNAAHSNEQNPEEVVALGAAYYSYYLEHENRNSKRNSRFSWSQSVTTVV